jgi:hypothetical protein
LLKIAPGSFQLEQVEASIDVAGVKFQHFAKALGCQVRLVTKGVGISQGRACTNEFWIQAKGL